jgi:homoserine kinase type II
MVFQTVDRSTGVEHTGRLWELTEWLPGFADFHERPSAARLETACTALARLHGVWRDSSSAAAVCPAVKRRLEFLDEWSRLLRSGWNPLAAADRTDLLFPLVEQTWRRLPAALERVPACFRRWDNVVLPLQPCLCDLWHDHLLFEDDRLTGILDYGSVKIDHVAVDLARMLGSLVKENAEGWQTGLRAYRQFAPLGAEEEELAHALDETGTILGVANWFRWLYHEKRTFPDRTAVARRLAQLVERLDFMGERPASAG